VSPEDRLRERLDAFPRVPLAAYPSPLQHLPRLSAELDRPVYVKRDDGIGPAGGGNKTRKLEYLLAEARESGARRVVTYGGLQSNHARITAAAALGLGLEPHLFYLERRPENLTGNLLLNELAGARMHFFPARRPRGRPVNMDRTNRLVRLLARLRVGVHYFIPVGGHSWRGCLGYARAALELHEQARAQGIPNAWVVTAAGTGGTLAGLMAGVRLAESPLRLRGLDIGRLWTGFPETIARVASETCARLGSPVEFAPERVPLIEETYVGEGYGTPSAEGVAAIRRLAATEGLLLDPVYTAKAFAGLLDLARRGELGRGEPIIFVHTGGQPALYALGDRLLEH
jgi:1-aminocyclopropane-1-carboxylate deaminase/D-cysteine desulfhydrase-like pyridoxal-dependent ACC family enzyme